MVYNYGRSFYGDWSNLRYGGNYGDVSGILLKQVNIVKYKPLWLVEEEQKKAKQENNKSSFDLEGWQHLIGPSLLGLAAPSPKRFVAPNSSQTSAVLSEALSELFPRKISLSNGSIRRLYTHTVNGVPRYAATWGRFAGRWGTRIAGGLGIALTLYDFTTEIAIPMGYGVQGYTETYKDAGLIYHVK